MVFRVIGVIIISTLVALSVSEGFGIEERITKRSSSSGSGGFDPNVFFGKCYFSLVYRFCVVFISYLRKRQEACWI